MKIDNKILKQFLKQVNLDNSLNEVVLNFEKEGLSVCQMTPDSVALVNAKLSSSAFTEYDKFDKLAFDNLNLFIKFLDLFGDENIDIKMEKNYLYITNENENGNFILTSEDYIKKETEMPKIEYKNTLKIDSSILKEITKSSDLLSSDFNEISFEIKDKNLIIETGETHKIRKTIKLTEKTEDCKVKFGNYINKCSKLLQDEVVIKLNKDMPITIEQKSDNSRVTYIIAPKISDD